MRKVALRRPIIILLALIVAGCILYVQRNYRTIPDLRAAVTPVYRPVEQKGVTIIAAGDISCSTQSPNYNNGDGNSQGCHMKNTAELARSLKPEALLLLGDLQYDDGSLSQFQGSYSRSWGTSDLLNISKPAPGNHEYGTKNAAGYFAYFGAKAGDPDKGYYSFDVGDWHFVALNSNCSIVACDMNSEQVRWLNSDLSNSASKCTIAYYHHPLFSSGTHGSNEFMRPLFETLDNAGVDIVLAGHDHLYERFAPQNSLAQHDINGVRSFIVGTGGKDHYPFRVAQPNSEIRISTAFGVLKLELTSMNYRWEFKDENKAVLDAGADMCR